MYPDQTNSGQGTTDQSAGQYPVQAAPQQGYPPAYPPQQYPAQYQPAVEQPMQPAAPAVPYYPSSQTPPYQESHEEAAYAAVQSAYSAYEQQPIPQPQAPAAPMPQSYATYDAATAQNSPYSSMYPYYYGDSAAYGDILSATQTDAPTGPKKLAIELGVIGMLLFTLIFAGMAVLRVLRATVLNPAVFSADTLTSVSSADFKLEIPGTWKKVADPDFSTAYADNASVEKRYAVFGGAVKNYGTAVNYDKLSVAESKKQLEKVATEISNATGSDVGLNCGEGSTGEAAVAQHAKFKMAVEMTLHCLDPTATKGASRDKEIRGYVAFKGSKSYIFVIQADTKVWQKNEEVFTTILDGVTPK